jgi:hypothetical protein
LDSGIIKKMKKEIMLVSSFLEQKCQMIYLKDLTRKE